MRVVSRSLSITVLFCFCLAMSCCSVVTSQKSDVKPIPFRLPHLTEHTTSLPLLALQKRQTSRRGRFFLGTQNLPAVGKDLNEVLPLFEDFIRNDNFASFRILQLPVRDMHEPAKFRFSARKRYPDHNPEEYSPYFMLERNTPPSPSAMSIFGNRPVYGLEIIYNKVSNSGQSSYHSDRISYLLSGYQSLAFVNLYSASRAQLEFHSQGPFKDQSIEQLPSEFEDRLVYKYRLRGVTDPTLPHVTPVYSEPFYVVHTSGDHELPLRKRDKFNRANLDTALTLRNAGDFHFSLRKRQRKFPDPIQPHRSPTPAPVRQNTGADMQITLPILPNLQAARERLITRAFRPVVEPLYDTYRYEFVSGPDHANLSHYILRGSYRTNSGTVVQCTFEFLAPGNQRTIEKKSLPNLDDKVCFFMYEKDNI